MRYNNGLGYIWINNTELPFPKVLMHPTMPKLDGTRLIDKTYYCTINLYGSQAKKGDNLLSAIAKICKKNNDGFIAYLWPKPFKNNLSQKYPKLSYVKKICSIKLDNRNRSLYLTTLKKKKIISPILQTKKQINF